MVADWFHEEVVVVAILKRQWRKMPRPQNLLGLYSVRFTWEHPGASLGAGTLSWVMLWIRGCCRSLWHLWTCHSCYISVLSVQLRPLWLIMALQQRWEPSAMCDCPGTAWQGSYHSWAHWSEDEVTGPACWGLPLSWALSTPAGAPRAGLTPTLHCSSFPQCLTSSIPALLPLVDTFLSPDLGPLNNTIPIILSHVQIPADRHIWGGVGFRDGCRWTPASLQFVTKNTLLMFTREDV